MILTPQRQAATVGLLHAVAAVLILLGVWAPSLELIGAIEGVLAAGALFVSAWFSPNMPIGPTPPHHWKTDQ